MEPKREVRLTDEDVQPRTIVIDEFVPYSTPQEYADSINRAAKRGKPLQTIQWIRQWRLPGHFVQAEVTDEGKVWAKFIPQKLGKWWVSFHEQRF